MPNPFSWLSRLRNHLRTNRISRDIEREMAFHLAERADDLVAVGMTPEEARHEARRRFGNVGLQRERTRERDLFAWLDTLIADLRYALRALRASPGFALVAICSLALGIGANTAIFSILDAVMLKSLPVRHPEELVTLARGGGGENVYTNPLWEAIRDRQDVFSGLFAFGMEGFNLTAGGEARRVSGDLVSGDFFSTLGVRTAVGRPIVHADDYRGCPGIAVLSNAFWQRDYAGDPRAVGRLISLDGHPFQIVGVTDARFFGVNVGAQPQVYVPLCSEAIVHGTNSWLDGRSTWFLQIIGRPKPDVSPRQIAARFATLAPAIAEATLPPNWPAHAVDDYKHAAFSVMPAAKGFSELRSTYRKALYMLTAIVALVLLVACANVANLLLARGTVRGREMAVRLALGAGRARLARQLITESLLLSSLGAALGVVIAMWGSRVLVHSLSADRGVSLDLSVDMNMLMFTIGVVVTTGLLFGLPPAWRAGRVDPQVAMKAQGRGVVEGRTRFTLGNALVVGQVAMSLVLIAAAGLLLGSWRKLAAVDPGFRREQVLLVATDISPAHVAEGQRPAVFGQILERMRALPGVRAASVSRITPVGHAGWNEMLKVEGFTPASERDALAWANGVSEGYFATMGTPLLSGRDFDGHETSTSAPVAIVSEAMARKFFGTATAVGRRFQIEQGSGWGSPIEVIGVAGNTKYRSLRDSAQPIIYFPRSQQESGSERLNFEIRADADPLGLVPAVKAALAQVDPRFTLDFTTLERQVAESMTVARTVATLSGFFGALALLLATIGLYGIMTYAVARRRNEIGVRIALGAERSRVIRMVLADASRITVFGVVLGVALALGVTRLVSTFLYGLKPNDPVTLGASAILLLAVGLLATAFPAWRAALLDPVTALREE
jgi:putative ABC transport system permease protein